MDIEDRILAITDTICDFEPSSQAAMIVIGSDNVILNHGDVNDEHFRKEMFRFLFYMDKHATQPDARVLIGDLMKALTEGETE